MVLNCIDKATTRASLEVVNMMAGMLIRLLLDLKLKREFWMGK